MTPTLRPALAALSFAVARAPQDVPMPPDECGECGKAWDPGLVGDGPDYLGPCCDPHLQRFCEHCREREADCSCACCSHPLSDNLCEECCGCGNPAGRTHACGEAGCPALTRAVAS